MIPELDVRLAAPADDHAVESGFFHGEAIPEPANLAGGFDGVLVKIDQ